MGNQLSIEVEKSTVKEKVEEIHRIDFDVNLNGKLHNIIFSTIRPKNDVYFLMKKYAVYLNGRFFFYAYPILCSEMSLKAIIESKIHLLDSGLHDLEFMALMTEKYSKKAWWYGDKTIVQNVFFERIKQLNLF